MVVRLDLEGANPAFANINDAGILARALYHHFRARGQPLQVNFGRFVRAVLAPHHAEDSELRQRGRAAQYFQEFLVFLLRKPMFAEQLRSDFNSLLSGRHGGKLYFRTSNKFSSLVLATFAGALLPADPPPAPARCAARRPSPVSAEPYRKWLRWRR